MENMEEAGLAQSVPGQFYKSPQTRKRSSRFIFLIIAILLIGALIFAGSKFLGSKGQNTKSSPTPTPTESVFPSDTPTPEVSETPGPSNTPTPKPTTNPVDKATGLDRSDLTVEVQNGSGEVGAASKVSETLKSFGYHVVSIGNADNFNYENVTINVKSDQSKYLSLLKKDLTTVYTIGSSSASLSASSSADALVIIGKQ